MTDPLTSNPFSFDFLSLEEALRKHYYSWEGAKQFEGTAGRLARAYEDFCWSTERIQAEVDKALSAEFVYNFDEMLVEGPIDAWTLCPHHLLPCHFEVYIGYIPTSHVLGLSKLARIAVALAKRPVMQEMYTQEIAAAISTLNPQGVGVFVLGQHGCMQARGIKQRAGAATAVLKGTIKDRPDARQEFYTHIERLKQEAR